MTTFFEKREKFYFWAILDTFWPNMAKWNFLQKIGLCQFLDITIT